jgi:hypothetical protein
MCVPGTYEYMARALLDYKNDPQLISVDRWNHPGVTPGDIVDSPYFDGRYECLVW